LFNTNTSNETTRLEMRKTLLTVVALAGAIVVVGSITALSGNTRVERGRYLVTMIGCNDCHTR
jgi:hypothetical protein